MALKIDAKPVIMSFTHNTKDKAAQLGNFLKAANSSGLQSPAIVSYFTELNKVSDNKHLLSKGAADRFDKLIDLIDQEVKSNPDLKKEYGASSLKITLSTAGADPSAIAECLVKNGTKLYSLTEKESSLEQFFLRLTHGKTQ